MRYVALLLLFGLGSAQAVPIRLEFDGSLYYAQPALFRVGDPVSGYIEFDPERTNQERPDMYFGGVSYLINIFDYVVSSSRAIEIFGSQDENRIISNVLLLDPLPTMVPHPDPTGSLVDDVAFSLYGFSDAIQWNAGHTSITGFDFSRLVFGRFNVISGSNGTPGTSSEKSLWQFGGDITLRKVEVPEPATLGLLGAGIALLAFGRRAKR